MPTEISAPPTFTHYPTYDEMSSLLEDWAARFPRWCRLSEIGRKVSKVAHCM